MNSFDYCIDQLEKAGVFKSFPESKNHWFSFRRSPLYKPEQKAQNKPVYNIPDQETGLSDFETQQKKKELSMIYFQIDSMKELYEMQEKQLKGNISEKQRLTIKNSLLSKAVKISKLEQKAGKLEKELNLI